MHSTHRHPHTIASLWLWGTLLVLTLVWDASEYDLSAMTWLGGPKGFAWRDHWWLSSVMHTGAKQLAVLIYLGVLAMTVWPQGVWLCVALVVGGEGWRLRFMFSGWARLECFCLHRPELAVVDLDGHQPATPGTGHDRGNFAKRVGLGAVADPQRGPLPQPHSLDRLGLRGHGLGQPWFVCVVAHQA